MPQQETGRPLRIAGANTKVVRLPVDPPIKTAIHDARFIDHVLLRLESAEGHHGIGHLFAFGDQRAQALEATIRDLLRHLVGSEVHHPDACWDQLQQQITFLGRTGMAQMAVAAVDTAVWDLWARRADMPLWAVLGAPSAKPVPCYASDSLWLGDPLEALPDLARTRAGEGFTQVKVRIGGTPDDDERRVDAVVNAVPGLAVMADANQGWDREQALAMAVRLAPYGLRWLEEPTDMDDLEGLKTVVDASPTPIATGESWFGPLEIRRGLEAADFAVLMPDLQRAGGITGWLRAAALAKEHGRTVSPHLFPEISIHMLCGIAQPGPVEYVPWFRPLFADPPAPIQGGLAATDRTGLGLQFRPGLLD